MTGEVGIQLHTHTHTEREKSILLFLLNQNNINNYSLRDIEAPKAEVMNPPLSQVLSLSLKDPPSFLLNIVFFPFLIEDAKHFKNRLDVELMTNINNLSLLFATLKNAAAKVSPCRRKKIPFEKKKKNTTRVSGRSSRRKGRERID